MEKGIIADRKPKVLKLEPGKTYYWCSCGRSGDQPFCNGAHKVTALEPLAFTTDKDKPVALCTCKQTSTPPYCDGTHSKLG